MLLPALLLSVVSAAPLTTLAEQSGYVKTGRYAEVLSLCGAFEQRYKKRVRCTEFGKTPEGRPMVALIASDSGTLDAAQAHQRKLPVMLFQGGIHAGEIDGKDAGFAFLRDVLDGKIAPGSLSTSVLVFVPVFNVDGHERFGPNNRPNQVGPQEMGWRTTAQNLNLNRDYAKADAPEMQAMLRLLTTWDPIVYLDLHVTDGAEFQPDIAVLISPQLAGPALMRPAGMKLSADVMQRLKERKHLPLAYYPSFEREDDPASGFGVGAAPPRFSVSYWALRNRFGVLVETHSWKNYATRVRGTYNTLAIFQELLARDGAQWLNLAAAADRGDGKSAGSTVALAVDHSDKKEMMDFPGYAYVREPSPISGAMRIRYDNRSPQTWRIPFYPELKVMLEATAPSRGYYVPPAYAQDLQKRLAQHGFESEILKTAATRKLGAFRVTERKFRPEPYEGRLSVQLKGAWVDEERTVPAGSLFVSVNQPGAALLVHLMEPTGPDSYAAWGFFNAHLEQKEYLEPYVAEAEALKMLERDPALRETFYARLASDPEFAKDAAARLMFFYRRHPSFDTQWDLLPILRE